MADVAELTARVAALESRIEELAVIQNVLVRLLSTTRPLARVLEQYGANETQEQALYRLLDRLGERVRGPERDRTSFAYFKRGLSEIFASLHNDREFVQLLIDTLKVERPAYRDLHEYMIAHRWPVWD